MEYMLESTITTLTNQIPITIYGIETEQIQQSYFTSVAFNINYNNIKIRWYM
jgi:hypothetical protein